MDDSAEMVDLENSDQSIRLSSLAEAPNEPSVLIKDQDAQAPPRRATVEDYIEDAPNLGDVPHPQRVQGFAGAGATLGKLRTQFEAIRDDQVLKGAEILGPFASDEEWQLAKWLIKNVGHNQAEQFLKLPIIQDQVDPSFKNKDGLMATVDALPPGVSWKLENVILEGDACDDDNKPLREELELWYQDPVDVVKELLGNPMFRGVICYAPEKIHCDKDLQD
ncbi:hypothetical protein HWV62_9927 [Athelia sp. TMB]|nr:hypothetical protein HWV62_9927 [Athelia sp. TMB]